MNGSRCSSNVHYGNVSDAHVAIVFLWQLYVKWEHLDITFVQNSKYEQELGDTKNTPAKGKIPGLP